MPKPLDERIQESLDVSGAFDNCFFHTYATHLLANQLPLPEDLFTFKSIKGEDSPASQLQTRFPNQESLSLFAEYTKSHPSEKTSEEESSVSPDAPVSPNFIVEKTIVMGFLMREWFATKMAQSTEIQGRLESGAVAKFASYKEFRGFMSAKDLQTGPEGVLYIANKDFLEYFNSRPTSGHLTSKQRHFEQYFVNAGEDTEKALKNFWNSEGYQNYCRLISTPGTKLAPNDVTPVIQMLNQPISIYSPEQTVIYEQAGSKEIPPMEIMLDAGAGHYHLLKTPKTSSLLDEYDSSFKQYKTDRAAVLATEGDKDLAASSKSSVFVGAICPSGHLSQSPFALLLDKVDYLATKVPLTSAPLTSTSAPLTSTSAPLTSTRAPLTSTSVPLTSSVSLADVSPHDKDDVLKLTKEFIQKEMKQTSSYFFQKYTPEQKVLLQSMEKNISIYQEQRDKQTDKVASTVDKEALFGLLSRSLSALSATQLPKENLLPILKQIQGVLAYLGKDLSTKEIAVAKSTALETEPPPPEHLEKQRNTKSVLQSLKDNGPSAEPDLPMESHVQP